MPKPQYNRAWQTTRKTILKRDNNTCQIQGPHCTGTATHVDHIKELRHHGPRLDPNNLRATCQTCNLTRPRQQPQPSRHW